MRTIFIAVPDLARQIHSDVLTIGAYRPHGKLFKEGCNSGHGLSAAVKLGSLEKTVGTCLLHSGVCTMSSPFHVEKTALHNLLPS